MAAAGAGPTDDLSGYAAFGGDGVARWGDYSAAVPAENGSIWIATEFIPGGFGFPRLPGELGDVRRERHAVAGRAADRRVTGPPSGGFVVSYPDNHDDLVHRELPTRDMDGCAGQRSIMRWFASG